MSEAASLEIKVSSDGVALAKDRLLGLHTAGAKAEQTTGNLAASFGKMLAPILSVTAAVGGLMKLIEVNREFDKLNAGLHTATGSAEDAKVAFGVLEQFAADTPFSLREVTDTFIQLVNRGMDPSKKAMIAFGDMASAMGGSLEDVTRAVTAAIRGEYEPIRQYVQGVSKQGDLLTMNFRGTQTVIKNNAQAIQGYLVKLSEDNWAGAMARRMASLDGALSNLGDSYDKMYRKLGDSSIGAALKSAIAVATSALDELSAKIGSGELEMQLSALTGTFDGWASDIKAAFMAVGDGWALMNGGIRTEWGDTVGFMGEVFKTFPATVRAIMQAVVTGFADGFVKIKNYNQAAGDAIIAVTTGQFGNLKIIGKQFEENESRRKYTYEASITDIANERQRIIDAYDAKMFKSKQMREAYDKEQAAKKKANEDTDQLGKYKKQTKEAEDLAAKKKAAAAAATAEKANKTKFQADVSDLMPGDKIEKQYNDTQARINKYAKGDQQYALTGANRTRYVDSIAKMWKEGRAEFEKLADELKTEDEKLQAAYMARRKIIEDNTVEGSPEQQDLLARDNRKYNDDQKRLDDQRRAKIEAAQKARDDLYQEYLTEEEALKASQERKRQIILDSEDITASERNDLLRRQDEKNAKEKQAREMAIYAQTLQSAEITANNLAAVAERFGGQQSQAYRILFATSKAFSIAQGAMSIATGLAKAQELGWPASLPAMMSVAAAGSAIMAQITGANFSGGYDKGGHIPAGSVGVVGERGPEIVRGPADVTSRADTARLLQGGNPVNLRIINSIAPELVHGMMGSEGGEQVILNVLKRNRTTVRALAAG